MPQCLVPSRFWTPKLPCCNSSHLKKGELNLKDWQTANWRRRKKYLPQVKMYFQQKNVRNFKEQTRTWLIRQFSAHAVVGKHHNCPEMARVGRWRGGNCYPNDLLCSGALRQTLITAWFIECVNWNTCVLVVHVWKQVLNCTITGCFPLTCCEHEETREANDTTAVTQSWLMQMKWLNPQARSGGSMRKVKQGGHLAAQHPARKLHFTNKTSDGKA